MTPEAIEQLTSRKLALIALLTPELSQAGRARLFLRDE